MRAGSNPAYHFMKKPSQNKNRQPANRVEIEQIYRSTRWKKVSALKRKRDPLCEDPFRVHLDNPELAAHVHHKIPLKIDSSKAFDYDNLQSLCRTCHWRLENK